MRKLFQAVQLTDEGKYLTASSLTAEILADEGVDPDIRERAEELKGVVDQALDRERLGLPSPVFQIGSFILSGLSVPSMGD